MYHHCRVLKAILLAAKKPDAYIIKTYATLTRYVENSKPCDCFICKAKRQNHVNTELVINKLNDGEPISPYYIPKIALLSITLQGNQVKEDTLTRSGYLASFLYMLQLEQKRWFSTQYVILASGGTLNYKDILASSSPFFNKENGLIHMGGRVGAYGQGDRSIEYMTTFSTHYKMILPNNGRFVTAFLLDIHQRNQCCSPAFMMTVVSENFYLPRPKQFCK